jgi:two-component system phosphate regulon sensor histidine kinase PhoR
VVKRLFPARKQAEQDETAVMAVEAARGRALIEESPELVVVLDAEGRVAAASRRARQGIDNLRVGGPLPAGALRDLTPFEVPVDVLGRGETLVYLGRPPEEVAYEELRTGFTAVVSHELRTPLARLLALLESALLADADPQRLVEQARDEVVLMRELIDDVLFLSELETGKEIVSLGSTPAAPIVAEVLTDLAESAERAGVRLESDVPEGVELPLRARMLRVVLENLVANSLRYGGPGTTCRIALEQAPGGTVLSIADDGVGVDPRDLPRLFERFYRTDRARASRGTGLGLAIVKHVVTSADGAVEATKTPGGGLTIRCRFPTL